MRKQLKIIFLLLLSSRLISSENQNTLQNSPLYYLNNLVQKQTEIKKIDTPQIDLIKDLWDFLRVRKKYWLAPLIITIVFMGCLIVFTQGSVVAPFIYSIF